MKNLKYKSKEEAIQDHKKNYRFMGIVGGKGYKNSADKYRIDKIINVISHGDIVLDIACNDGLLSCAAMGKGAVVYGIDVVVELVNIAQMRGIIAKEGCAEKLEFDNIFFDVVMAGEILEHLFDPNESLSEIVRVLKPDGVFTGSVPHPDGGLGRNKIATYHQQFFEVEELRDLLLKYFINVKLESTVCHIDYCKEFNIDIEKVNWLNFECREIR